MLGALSWAFAFVAGASSILSPCVLPLLPIVLGAANVRGRGGAVALGAGLTISFTVVGLFVATVGYAIGLDAELLRRLGGAMMVALGGLLLAPALQGWVSTVTAPVTQMAGAGLQRYGQGGVWSQAGLGGLLGLVWTPCVGPTLGAAAILAAQGRDFPQVAATMFAFGIGAATPLVMIGALSAKGLRRWRGRMRTSGEGSKRVLGVALLLLGALMVSGLDKGFEALLVQASPAWLTRLTSSI